jgi:hypothetical protein
MNPAKWFSTSTKKPKDSHLNSANPNATTTRYDARKQSEQEKQSQQENLLSTYRKKYSLAWHNLNRSMTADNPDIIRRLHDHHRVYHIIKHNKQIFQQIVEYAISKGCMRYLGIVNYHRYRGYDVHDVYSSAILQAVREVKDEILIALVKDKPLDYSLFITKNGDYNDFIKSKDPRLTDNLTEYFMKEFPR